MKVEEVIRVLDLVFSGIGEDFISYDFSKEDDLDEDIGCLEINLYQCYEDNPETKFLYFNKDTRELIYCGDNDLRKRIKRLQQELEDLKKMLTNKN